MKSEAGKRTPKKVVCSSDLVILLPLFGHSESPESTGFFHFANHTAPTGQMTKQEEENDQIGGGKSFGDCN